MKALLIARFNKKSPYALETKLNISLSDGSLIYVIVVNVSFFSQIPAALHQLCERIANGSIVVDKVTRNQVQTLCSLVNDKKNRRHPDATVVKAVAKHLNFSWLTPDLCYYVES